MRNRYGCLTLLIQLWGINIYVVLFLSSLMLRKVDGLQKFCSLNYFNSESKYPIN